MTEKTLLQQYVQIGVVVAAYWFISITLGKGNYHLTIDKEFVVLKRPSLHNLTIILLASTII